jgi:methylenetetrahydrofolate dehydrogenase (NADP+) / methenyltetrahydrofolate cyclohydrolase
MTAQILAGRPIQREMLARVAESVRQAPVPPHVALIRVDGDDPLVQVNFRLHERVFREVGFVVTGVGLPAGTDQGALNAVIEGFNDNDAVDAIMVLLPLPEHLDMRVVLATIAPEKEVEGLHPDHAARLSPLSALPPTRFPVVPMALLNLLSDVELETSGMHVVVLTDPDLIETNPVAKMIARVAAFGVLPPDASGAVVPCTHPRAAELTRQADLLVVSLLRPKMVTADWVRPGAVVLDFNPVLDGFDPHPTDPERTVARLVGGLDVASVAEVASVVAPVPGGMGPVLIATLAEQIALAASMRPRRTVAADVA